MAVLENDEDYEKYDELNKDLEDITEKISQHCSDKNREIVEDIIGDSDFGIEGFSQIKPWSLKKRLYSKNAIEPPAAKKDINGKLITEKNELENLYLETYNTRLNPHVISYGTKNLKRICISNKQKVSQK